MIILDKSELRVHLPKQITNKKPQLQADKAHLSGSKIKNNNNKLPSKYLKLN